MSCMTQLAIFVWILNYWVDWLILCLEIWCGHHCSTLSGFENSSLFLKAVAKTVCCYIVTQLHCFPAWQLAFPELLSTKPVGSSHSCILPVILRGEWGFCGRNAHKYLTTEWMDLVSDLYSDFRGFPVSWSVRNRARYWMGEETTREDSSPSQKGFQKKCKWFWIVSKL